MRARADRRAGPGPRGWVAALLSVGGLLVGVAVSGCGSAKPGSAGRGADGSAASCVGLTPSQAFADARRVIVGTMLPGATSGSAGQRVLISPARMRVSKYLKGSGPRIVTVQTGELNGTSGMVVSEDGILPRAGQRWKIYTNSTAMPYQTSICSGSELLAAGAVAMPVDEPANFVAIATSAGRWVVELRSPETGRTARVLSRFGQWFTNNGLALSPDGRHVYVTLIPHGHQSGPGLRLVQIDTRTGRRSPVADGEQPAVSGDGNWLASATGSDARTVAVRSLHGRGTRRLNLAGLLRGAGDLLDGTLTWLGDGSELVVEPGPIAYAAGVHATSGAHGSSGARSGGCAVRAHAQCLIVVTVPARGQLTARRVTLRIPPGVGPILSGELDRLHALLSASPIGPHAGLYRITISSSGVSDVRLFGLPESVMVLGFDPDGERVLYLRGHIRPQLWSAWIGRRGLTRARKLGRDTAPVAW